MGLSSPCGLSAWTVTDTGKVSSADRAVPATAITPAAARNSRRSMSHSWCRNVLGPNVGPRGAGREPHFVGPDRAVGFLAEIDDELLVEREAALFRVGVQLDHERSRLGEAGVELVVPTAEERVGDVESFAVEAELEHLRAAGGLAA